MPFEKYFQVWNRHFNLTDVYAYKARHRFLSNNFIVGLRHIKLGQLPSPIALYHIITEKKNQNTKTLKPVKNSLFKNCSWISLCFTSLVIKLLLSHFGSTCNYVQTAVYNLCSLPCSYQTAVIAGEWMGSKLSSHCHGYLKASWLLG